MPEKLKASMAQTVISALLFHMCVWGGWRGGLFLPSCNAEASPPLIAEYFLCNYGL